MKNTLKKHDVVFGMGSMCSCSQALREAGLQLTSFPFDWNGGPGVRGKTDLMLDDFCGFLERDRMVRKPVPKFSHSQLWEDDRMFKFIHDFPVACDFENELPKVREKYARRIARLYDLIGKAKSVLIVYIACQGWADCTVEDAAYCRRRLAERWPDVWFDFLLFRYDEGIPFDRRREENFPGCRVVTFDYRDRKETDWRADWHQIGKWLKTQYEVVDYRTDAEREKWRQAHSKRADWARYHATSWFDYLVTKFRYKIYKHLRTQLDRRGII